MREQLEQLQARLEPYTTPAIDAARSAVTNVVDVIKGLLHQLAVFAALFTMQSWVAAAWSETTGEVTDAIKTAIHFCGEQLGMVRGEDFAQQTGVALPADEMDRLVRDSTAVTEGTAKTQDQLAESLLAAA